MVEFASSGGLDHAIAKTSLAHGGIGNSSISFETSLGSAIRTHWHFTRTLTNFNPGFPVGLSAHIDPLPRHLKHDVDGLSVRSKTT